MARPENHRDANLMPVLYRVQSSDGADWFNEWFAHKSDAVGYAELARDIYVRVTVERIEIGTSREDLALSLNCAHVNRTNWAGEII